MKVFSRLLSQKFNLISANSFSWNVLSDIAELLCRVRMREFIDFDQTHHLTLILSIDWLHYCIILLSIVYNDVIRMPLVIITRSKLHWNKLVEVEHGFSTHILSIQGFPKT